MVTKLSTKGQVVLPSAIRRRLGLRPGDPLDVKAEGDRIVLTSQKKQTCRKAKIVIDPISGIPAVTLGPGAPVLTHKEVKEMLSDFP
jgi:AbrB family looped-hinge helix DNA binding protein